MIIYDVLMPTVNESVERKNLNFILSTRASAAAMSVLYQFVSILYVCITYIIYNYKNTNVIIGRVFNVFFLNL